MHHSEMMPQFDKSETYRFSWERISVGLSIFLIGLFKKVILADHAAGYATPVFDSALSNDSLTFVEAWGGALAYTFQLYFDFSGYSDMAIGIARMFGVVLPQNFFSPYKSSSIIDFWRRWHITLSRFLRDYLYIPLGGSRKGKARRYINLMLTMLLGGLWHGAAWTFVIWGGLHGLYLLINYGWRSMSSWVIPKPVAILLTFFAVVVSWVYFRAESFPAATNILTGMAGFNGVLLPLSYQSYLGGAGDWLAASAGFRFESDVGLFQGFQQIAWLVLCAAIVWIMPNTQEIFSKYKPTLDFSTTNNMADTVPHFLVWRPTKASAVIIIFLGVFAILSINKYSEFLYFQF